MTQQIVRNVKIIGTGSYVPEEIRDNHWFERVGSNDEWIYKNLGVKERRIAADDQATSDLAAAAAQSALENAGLCADDIDLIIVGTETPDRNIPATATIVQNKIKAPRVAAFDVNNTCAGFLYGMSAATQFIATGMYDKALVIGADIISRIIDWTDRNTCVFFGDAAGAVVLAPCAQNEKGIQLTKLYSDGKGLDTVYLPGGGSAIPFSQEVLDKKEHLLSMNGKGVWEAATKLIPHAIIESIKEAGLTADKVDHVIPHQPSKSMLKKIAENAGIPWEKVHTCMDKYANCAHATIPLMLDISNREGKFKQGDTLVLTTIGSGWAWGATILTWEKH